MMPHRTVRGRIIYTSKKPEILDQKRGEERFSYTHHGDGSVVYRAACEASEPHPTVVRDILYSMGPGGTPRNLHVHLVVGDAFMGSGWFDFTPGAVDCESVGPSIGRVSQHFAYEGAIDAIGTHPVTSDGWTTRCMDIAKGPHRRNIRCLLPSADHRGASPPMMTEVNIDLEYVGDETVTVQAGTFDCRHFRFIDASADGMGGSHHPNYDVWVTADADSILVQGAVSGHMMNWYELVELER